MQSTLRCKNRDYWPLKSKGPFVYVTKKSYGYNPNDIIFIEYDGTTEYVDEDVITVYGEMNGEHSYNHKLDGKYQFLVCSQIHLNKKGSPIIK